VTPIIDADGSVHIPALVVPYSSLASAELRRNFILRRRPATADATRDQTSPRAILDLRRTLAEQQAPIVARFADAFAVDINPELISGVQTDVVTPRAGVSRSNQDRVLINLHGGGMTVGGRWGGQEEAIPIASLARIKVVAIDYRMYPEWRFPAASEDVAAVYRALLTTYPAQNVGIYGCSAGADLTAQAVAWFQAHRLPRPGAIGLFSSGAGVSQGLSDSNYVAAALQGASTPLGYPVSATGEPGYLSGADLSSPLVSPVYHPNILRKFPPTLLLSGTRDFLLSSVVYTHAQLVDAAVDSELHVWEGADHCFFALGEYDPQVPETRQAWRVIIGFFDKRLGGKFARRPLVSPKYSAPDPPPQHAAPVLASPPHSTTAPDAPPDTKSAPHPGC
jgi:acetyl esterase/lipase